MDFFSIFVSGFVRSFIHFLRRHLGIPVSSLEHLLGNVSINLEEHSSRVLYRESYQASSGRNTSLCFQN